SDVCLGEKEVKVACCVENDDGSGNENADCEVIGSDIVWVLTRFRVRL
nr:hypothetical protein [Tanacetum cinerariifolium]